MATKNLPLGTAPGTGTLMLPLFAPGMLLQSDDLSALGSYSRDLSRLLIRSLFGCGVVCGLKVTTLWKCDKLTITIDPGVALDGCGDPIQVVTTQKINIDPQCDPNFPQQLYVVLCEKNKCCAPRPAMCAADDGDSTPVCTREKYGYEIRVVKDRPDCACGCPDPEKDHTPLLKSECQCANPKRECYQHHYQGDCECDCCGSGADCTCDCNCVLLARLDYDGGQESTAWGVTHRVRRFVRPVLIEDPLVQQEALVHLALKEKQEKAAAMARGPAAVAQPAQPPAALLAAAEAHAAQVQAEAQEAEALAKKAHAADPRPAPAAARSHKRTRHT